MSSFSQVRNELMPVLHIAANKAADGDQRVLEFDLVIDFVRDVLVITGYNVKHNRSESFRIDRLEFEDGTYKQKFAPALQRLIEALR